MSVENATTTTTQSRAELSEELKRQALEFSQRVQPVKRSEERSASANAHQEELRLAILAESQSRRAKEVARQRAEKALAEQQGLEEEARQAEQVLAAIRIQLTAIP